MIISHSHKFIFIKSRKTAGTSIEAALSGSCEGADIVTPLGDYKHNRDEMGRFIHQSLNAGDFEQHDDALSIRNKIPRHVWDTYFKFSISRNPWDKVVSEFFWEMRQSPLLAPRKHFYHHLGIPYDELSRLRKLFSEFVNVHENTNDRFYFIDGDLSVDFVIRYETLVDDFGRVCSKIGIATPRLPTLKSGMRKEKRHYSEYYDEQSQSIIAAKYRNDIRCFGYRFERS
jgi:hypothetical protein